MKNTIDVKSFFTKCGAVPKIFPTLSTSTSIYKYKKVR